MEGSYDFSGWATRNDLLCADGRTIRKGAFSSQDGAKVPLVWQHQHNSVDNVLGHAILEDRNEGVYAYCSLNDSETGKMAKEIIRHGDVEALSIWANGLKQSRNGDVFHGKIRELSLVLAGANPGAYIDTVIAHGDDSEDSIECSYNVGGILIHEEDQSKATEQEDKTENSTDKKEEKKEMAEKTVQDVIDSMSEEQKEVMYALIGKAIEDAENNKTEDEEEMKHNAFENATRSDVLSHDAFKQIVELGKRAGSLKSGYQDFLDANALSHDDVEPDPEPTPDPYGIQYPDMLFPEAKNLNIPPEFIGRNMDWVQVVMTGVHHTPFSRVKNMYADITEDAARAKGYIKGNLKKEEVFSLLKRSTTPTTVYKKQKMDRDDIVDITDFDVLSWLKTEMRMMLNEELARAYLIGDGRLVSDDDHINSDNIRPIMNDADLFVIRWSVSGSDDTRAKNFIKASIKARKNYRGSGNPVLFTTEDMLTDMLLLEDQIGHKLYKTEQELATALRVKNIVTVPVMENVTDKDSKTLLGIIVNLSDYNVGADKGGAINFFDDFDIDYNQQKYLIETRCSGALVKPFSAIVLRAGSATESNEPSMADAMAPFKDPRLTASEEQGNG
jgi:HK97 family phage prohead protease